VGSRKKLTSRAAGAEIGPPPPGLRCVVFEEGAAINVKLY